MAESSEADFVLDASAAAKLLLNEAESPAFRVWYIHQVEQGATFVAPDLLGYEVAQLVARNFKPPAGGNQGWFGAQVARVVSGINLHAAYQGVGPYVPDLTAYDASYLATASAFRASLVTYDKKMQRAARSRGIALVAPT